jgi:hypothetical protein
MWLNIVMKRLLISILSMSLSGVCVAQAAPAKIGGPCSKINSFTHVSGVTLVCSTSGKKLVWKKLDTNQPTESGSTPQGSSSSLAIDPLVQKAFSTFDRVSCSGSHPNLSAEYLVSPNYSATMLEKQKILFDQAMGCYNQYFDRKVKISIALGTEKDGEFLASRTISGNPMFDASQIRWIQGSAARITATGNGTGNRAAGSAGWNVGNDQAWIVMLDSTFNTAPDSHMASHEFVHILQSYSRSKFFKTYGDGSTSRDYVNMPPWFWEGTAELFSYESIKSTVQSFNAQMLEARNQGKESPSLNKITNTDQVISTLELLQAPTNQEANMMNYALGSVACEYILGTYGYSSYWKIMQNAGMYQDFNENLQQSIGINLKDLYAKAAPFILSQWKQNNF